MPTPPKPYAVIAGEKKSHRTKAELTQRRNAERASLSGNKMKEKPEVRADSTAHKEFRRLKKLLGSIEKDDALYENIINRYCLLVAECRELEDRKDLFLEAMKEIKEKMRAGEGDVEKMAVSMAKIAGQMNVCDKILQQKRKQMFDIEKESIMTIASVLRSIPKKVEKKSNAMRKALGN